VAYICIHRYTYIHTHTPFPKTPVKYAEPPPVKLVVDDCSLGGHRSGAFWVTVCVYVYACVCMYTYVRVYFVYMDRYCVWIFIWGDGACTYVCVCIYVCVCMYVYICTCV